MNQNKNNHETFLRVRYGETDQMGVVYHANYATYFEVARTEWLRAYGMTYKNMEASGIMLPVVSLNISYKKPARYDDLLKVKTSVKKLPSVAIEFIYELYNDREELLATGETKLAFVNTTTGKLTKCPEELLDQLHK